MLQCNKWFFKRYVLETTYVTECPNANTACVTLKTDYNEIQLVNIYSLKTIITKAKNFLNRFQLTKP